MVSRLEAEAEEEEEDQVEVTIPITKAEEVEEIDQMTRSQCVAEVPEAEVELEDFSQTFEVLNVLDG